jgi:hypothetical protein
MRWHSITIPFVSLKTEKACCMRTDGQKWQSSEAHICDFSFGIRRYDFRRRFGEPYWFHIQSPTCGMQAASKLCVSPERLWTTVGLYRRIFHRLVSGWRGWDALGDRSTLRSPLSLQYSGLSWPQVNSQLLATDQVVCSTFAVWRSHQTGQ